MQSSKVFSVAVLVLVVAAAGFGILAARDSAMRADAARNCRPVYGYGYNGVTAKCWEPPRPWWKFWSVER